MGELYMSDALKRIEEKHARQKTLPPPRHRGVLICVKCGTEPYPCDVVKLARALDRARRNFVHCHGYEGAALDCERTLEEVVNG